MRNDDAATKRLVDVLQGADPDPWRHNVRDALARGDWAALKNLVASDDLDRQPAATLTFLYAVLHGHSPLYLEKELVLRRAQWRYPSDFWINHRLGCNLIWSSTPEHVRDGIGYMRAAVAARPYSSHAVMNLGNGYAHLQQYDSAAACFRKAIELEPKNSTSYSNLGGSLERLGRPDEALAAYEQATNLSPGIYSASAYAEASLIHSTRSDPRLRNISRASELAAKAVEVEPQASNHWTAVGIACYRGGQWQAALEALERSEKLGSHGSGGALHWDDPVNWFFLAMCHYHLGHGAEACQFYERAIAWQPQYPPNIERLTRCRTEAEALFGLGAKPEGAAANPAEQRLVPTAGISDAWARHILGSVLAQNGRSIEAEAAYRQSIGLEPNEAAHHRSLAELLRRQGKLDEAISQFDQLTRLRPGESDGHYALSGVYACRGQWDLAEASLQRADERNPGDLITLFKLATLCAYAGHEENYRRAAQTLVERFADTGDIGFADCTVKACSLAPYSGADASKLAKLVHSPVFKMQTGPQREWFEIARAMFEYRAGRFESAVTMITASHPRRDMHRDASAFAILAMAQHRLGKAQDASAALAIARGIVAEKLPNVEKGGTFGDDWHDWLHAQVLSREAEALLAEPKTR
jgi:tetratricopeptide (TPR) repeat protein